MTRTFTAAEIEARAKRFDAQCKWCYGNVVSGDQCASEQCHKDAAMLRQAAAGPPRCGSCQHFSNTETGFHGDRLGRCAHSDLQVPVDGSGFCHLHEATR